MALVVRFWPRREDVALLARRDIEQLRLRTVCRRHPIGRARGAGANAIPFWRWRGLFQRSGTPLYVFRIGPAHFRVGIRKNQLSRGAIQQIKISVAVRLGDEMLPS